MSDEFLLHGSIVFVFLWLAIGSLGAPLPEDAALLAAGVLIERGATHWAVAVLVAFVGVLGGDAVLFFLARRLGPAAYKRNLFQKILPPHRREKIERAYQRYGGRLVFLARHVAGLRAAVFAMAGISGMRPRKFLFWDAMAACVSIPLVMGLGYFGARHVNRMRQGIAEVHHYFILIAVIGLLAFITWRHVHMRSARLIGSRP